MAAAVPATSTKTAQQVTRLVVRRADRRGAHLVRITASPVTPAEIGRFAELPHTDSYVKVIFLRDGVSYPKPFDLPRARAELPRDQWPVLRSVTVRAVDVARTELVLDFVHHGGSGYAGPWAATAQVGSELLVLGPGGGYAPDPTADWHLLVGDDSALPAIAASLARMPEGVPVHAVIEVESPDDEQELPCPGALRVRWVHRSTQGLDALVAQVQALDPPPGRAHAFVHGEAGAVKRLRRYLVGELGLRPEQLSISGYWRRGYDDEGHRALKASERTQPA